MTATRREEELQASIQTLLVKDLEDRGADYFPYITQAVSVLEVEQAELFASARGVNTF